VLIMLKPTILAVAVLSLVLAGCGTRSGPPIAVSPAHNAQQVFFQVEGLT
jgi:hypothetical protein